MGRADGQAHLRPVKIYHPPSPAPLCGTIVLFLNKFI